MKVEEIISKRLPTWRKNPVLFMKEVLNKEPDKIQTRILNAVRDNDRVAVRSGHGIGKTFCASAIALWFLTCHFNSKVVTTAPTGRQVKEILWSEIHKNARGSILHDYMEFLTTKIKVTEEWNAIGVSSDRPENIEGFHADYLLFIIDEAKGVIQPIFDAIMGTQTTKTKILMISTPTPNPLGEFFNAFQPGSIYHTLHINAEDSPRVSKEWIKTMEKKYKRESPVFQMRVLGNFPDVSEDTLIPWQHVNAAVNRNLTIDTNRKYERVLGVDVARFGQDWTVLTVMEIQDGMYKMVDCEYFAKKPTTYTTGKIIEMDNRWHCNKIRVDAGGGDLGSAVVDMLMQTNKSFKTEAFVPGGTENFTESDKNYYLNWKSKGYDWLRTIFEQGRIDIKDVGDLCEQLILLRKDFTTAGKLKILDYEEEIKQTDVKHKSPDFSDSLSIACAPFKVEEFVVLDGKGLV
jgi:hypothetical protein